MLNRVQKAIIEHLFGNEIKDIKRGFKAEFRIRYLGAMNDDNKYQEVESDSNNLIFSKYINTWKTHYKNDNLHLSKEEGGVFDIAKFNKYSKDGEEVTAEDVRNCIDELISAAIEDARKELAGQAEEPVGQQRHRDKNNKLLEDEGIEEKEIRERESGISLANNPNNNNNVVSDELINHSRNNKLSSSTFPKIKIPMQDGTIYEISLQQIAEDHKRQTEINTEIKADLESGKRVLAAQEKHIRELEEDARAKAEELAAQKAKLEEEKQARQEDSRAREEQEGKFQVQLDAQAEAVLRLENELQREKKWAIKVSGNHNQMMQVVSQIAEDEYNRKCNYRMIQGVAAIGAGAAASNAAIGSAVAGFTNAALTAAGTGLAVSPIGLAALATYLVYGGISLFSIARASKSVGVDGKYSDLAYMATSNLSESAKITLEAVAKLINEQITKNLIKAVNDIAPKLGDEESDKVKKLSNKKRVIEATNNMISKLPVEATEVQRFDEAVKNTFGLIRDIEKIATAVEVGLAIDNSNLEVFNKSADKRLAEKCLKLPKEIVKELNDSIEGACKEIYRFYSNEISQNKSSTDMKVSIKNKFTHSIMGR